jgi:hypothetical protein
MKKYLRFWYVFLIFGFSFLILCDSLSDDLLDNLLNFNINTVTTLLIDTLQGDCLKCLLYRCLNG